MLNDDPRPGLKNQSNAMRLLSGLAGTFTSVGQIEARDKSITGLSDWRKPLKTNYSVNSIS
jgi:hypothetical protein